MNFRKFLHNLCISCMINLLGCALILAQPGTCTFSDSENQRCGSCSDRW